MKEIQQYLNKKNVYIGTIVSGLFGVVLFIMVISMKNYTTDIKSFSDLGSLVGIIKNFCNVYYVNFILLLIVTVACGIRLLKLNEQTLETKILTGGSGGALLLCIISLGGISSLKSVTSGNFSSITGLSDFEGQMKLIIIMLLLQIAIACYAGFLLLKNKSENQADITSKVTQMSSSVVDAEGISKPKVSLVAIVKTYYATMHGKKNILIASTVMGAILIVFLGISFFNSMKRTPIDLTKNCEVSFYGISGEGSADVTCTPDGTIDNVEISAFMDSITYEVENNGTLENGDTIEIKASFHEESADALKLEPENTIKSVEVDGLEVTYKKFEDIPKDESNNFQTATKQMLKAKLQKKVGGFFEPKAITIDEMECIATYYDYFSYSNSGTAYYIYRTKETKQLNDITTEKQINYYNVSIENINSKKEVNLEITSDDMDYESIVIYEKDKTDEKILTTFKRTYEDAQIIKENPSTLTYTNESVSK